MKMFSALFITVLILNVGEHETARILGVFPSSSISHQSVFRTLTQELARRGHDVVVVTANPAFPKGNTPANLTEIDVRNASIAYSKQVSKTAKGNNDDLFAQVNLLVRTFSLIVHAQLKTPELQTLIADRTQHFDLLLIEACMKPALIWSHFFKAPVILVSSFGPIDHFLDWTGAAMHPIIYPTTLHQRIDNLTFFEKVKELVRHYFLESVIKAHEPEDDKILRDMFGEDIPTVTELKKNVDMIFLDYHRIWDNNRPVPPNVVYLGALHMSNKAIEKLPQDLEMYLDNSRNGVIYMSLGTNTKPSLLAQEKVKILLKVFSQLPYDVLLKWDKGEIPGLPNNVRIFKWMPQSDLLRHPKIKVFIMQGGLQSTSEAILAGVPIIGMPMLGDQWYNVEQYLRHKIGLRVDLETLSEENLMETINTIIDDTSYRSNVIALREKLFDQPQTSLERAVWWTEHIIRHKGGKHLLASGARVSWTQYYELELLSLSLLGITAFIAVIGFVLFKTTAFMGRVLKKIFLPLKAKSC